MYSILMAIAASLGLTACAGPRLRRRQQAAVTEGIVNGAPRTDIPEAEASTNDVSSHVLDRTEDRKPMTSPGEGFARWQYADAGDAGFLAAGKAWPSRCLPSSAERSSSCAQGASCTSTASRSHHTHLTRDVSVNATSVFSPKHSSERGGTAFGDLLTACHQQLPTTFSQLFDDMKADRFTKVAQGKHSETFRVRSYVGDSALKVVTVDSVIKSWDDLSRKMLIASRLSGLRATSEHYTNGFLQIQSINCVLGSYPEELRGEPKSSATSHQPGKCLDEANPQRAYLAVHMSYAGVPLDRVELASALELWSILQQITLSLAVAEEAMEFEHRNLHLGHVLVKRTTEETCRFRFCGRSFVIKTWGLEARLSGFSWSRITDGGKSVFTEPTHMYATSSEHNLLFVYKKMAAIVSNKWHAFHPLTNLLFLRHVTKELHHRYRHRFRHHRDQQHALAWCEIASWPDRLLDYESLGDFVQENIKTLH